MKKWLAAHALFFFLCLLSCSVFAEIQCDCGEENCICFIQLGDTGIAVEAIIDLLTEQGYLEDSHGNTFDMNVYRAVCLLQERYGLSQTGMMDDSTLSLLTRGEEAAQYFNAPVDFVWVPTDGGKKCHSKPGCSGMYDPRKISAENAALLQISPCKRCNR